MRVGLIGCGGWGSLIRRALEDLGHDTVVYDPAHPDTMSSANRVCKIADKVVVAVPPQHQASEVNRVLEWGKPFFCEKPFTLNPTDAAFLRMSARMAGVHGAVGYIALHADGFPLDADKLIVRRQTESPGYHDVDAVWDLGAHDVAAFVHLFGRPDTVDYQGDRDTYQLRLENKRGVADLQGSRTGGKLWEYLVDGEHWTPYASKREPLKTEMEWWLDGGDNLNAALTTVETLSRCV